jgi:hypothetical protein
MNKTGLNTVRKLLAIAVLAAPAMEASADAVVDALMKSKVSGNFRLRYENVDLDRLSTTPAAPATAQDATALTLRSRLGIETAPISGFTGVLEFEDTQVLGDVNEYAPEANGYAPIVDPRVTEVNRAYLRYRGISRLDLGLGRQRILLDNQSFVGSVGWRQDEQTFDSFTANYLGVPDWTFYYAYISKVKGIASITPTYNFDLDTSDHLLNVAYTGFVPGKLTAYYYSLENNEPDTALRNVAPNVNELNPALRYQENETMGLRFDGFYLLPSTLPIRLLYTAEYAQQDYTNPAGLEFETDYSLIDVGAGYASPIGMLSLRVAQEVLGADTVGTVQQGFQTPYATKHAFNGWADMFLNTPATGIKDQYVTLAADLAPYTTKVMLMYHQYSEDDAPLAGSTSARDFGTEFNVQVMKQFGANYTLGVKYADYQADSEISTAANLDTKKLWLWAELNF